MAGSNVRPIPLTQAYMQELALSAKDRHGVADVTDSLGVLGMDTPGHVRVGAELKGDTARLVGKKDGSVATADDMSQLSAQQFFDKMKTTVKTAWFRPERRSRELAGTTERWQARWRDELALIPLEHVRPDSGAPVWYVKEIADIAHQRMGTGWKNLQARCRMHGGTQRFYCQGFGDADGVVDAEEGSTWAFVFTDADRAPGDYKMYTLPKEELYLSKCRNGEFRFTRYRSSTAGSHTSKRWVHHTTFFGNESPIYAAGVICKRKNIFYYKMQTGHYGVNQDLNQFKRLTSNFFAKEVEKGNALHGGYVYEDR